MGGRRCRLEEYASGKWKQFFFGGGGRDDFSENSVLFFFLCSMLTYLTREMENVSRGPTFGDLVTILTERSMQDVTVARLQSTRVYGRLSPPSFKCKVLLESLSEESQNIPCATLREEGRVVVNLCVSLYGT